MKWILYDEKIGTILGLESEKENINDEWKEITDEAYDFIFNHNGEYKVNIKSDLIFPITIDELAPIVDHQSVNGVANNLIRKNTEYCNMYIENGVKITLNDGTVKRYGYTTYDQLNIEQIFNLINQNIITDDIGVFIKFKDEHEYSNITVSEFKRLYKKLVQNKYFQLLYLRKYNDYIRTLDDINELHRLNYETGLPYNLRQEVQAIVDSMFIEGWCD